MKIATAQAKDGTPSAVPEGLCHLIETIGTPEFPGQMFGFVFESVHSF